MLTIDDVSHSYGNNPVLHGVSIEALPGKVLGLIGPNGSGKTTLLRMLYGAITPDAGTVSVAGRPIARMRAREIAREIAVVVQEPPGEVMHSVADAVLMGRTPHRKPFQRRSGRDEELAVSALERVGALHLAGRGLDELSGGEKQRVLLARAIVQEARCLLLDEPTNHLDIKYQHQVLHLVRGLGLTTVVVLHDLNLAARYCDRIVLLEEGRVQARGIPEEVLRPEVVQRVYGVTTQITNADDGALQFLFRAPDAPHAADDPHATHVPRALDSAAGNRLPVAESSVHGR